jgi:hypothetical protein
VDLNVGLHPTPSFLDWDLDGRRDLVIGAYDGKVHLIINQGSDTEPLFTTETFAMSPHGVMEIPSGSTSPIVVDFSGDGRPDIITGTGDGKIAAYLNVGDMDQPLFSFFTLLTSDGLTIDMPIICRTDPFACDWNDDGQIDLLVGCADGLVRLYLGYDGGVVSVEQPVVPATALLPPWPNPFNPTVSLTCRLAGTSPARLAIFDLGGRLVTELFNGEMGSGDHQLRWDGRDHLGRQMPSGVYFARLETDRTDETQKLVLLR